VLDHHLAHAETSDSRCSWPTVIPAFVAISAVNSSRRAGGPAPHTPQMARGTPARATASPFPPRRATFSLPLGPLRTSL